ncbi:MAG: hypothetical protein UY92_C0004G0064 [Candidatus Magasanikbacteria bacterium GW2011_GWA2_56_11]|uniref:Integral membrane protein n=1 Tax=Candidatus Magasanikbacteria bacterium GW2011_GWA2_56_11 TaxID=1619044 RepID=A0A0G1YH27_9BACT|nr:MAG: hypothetical protein UY92_C0004G0064 [Candidatus Magasanikbacteria bacterium GW2011_GWA2_56_11]
MPFWYKINVMVLLGAFTLTASPAAAAPKFLGDIDKQLNAGAGTAGLAAKNVAPADPRLVAASFIQTILKVLGVVFVVLIVTGGFRLVKANGDESKIEEGTKTVQMAVIGLLVVLFAYSIAWFVGTQIQKAINNAAQATSAGS